MPFLREGAGVTLNRGDVHYVVTEYGIAYLHGKNIRERAMDLIAIAHPEFRPRLIEEARRLNLIYRDQEFIPGERGEYPEHLETRKTTKTGLALLLRPVKISDEPLLKDFFYSLSDQSMYRRFMTPTAGHAPRAAAGVRRHRLHEGDGHPRVPSRKARATPVVGLGRVLPRGGRPDGERGVRRDAIGSRTRASAPSCSPT